MEPLKLIEKSESCVCGGIFPPGYETIGIVSVLAVMALVFIFGMWIYGTSINRAHKRWFKGYDAGRNYAKNVNKLHPEVLSNLHDKEFMAGFLKGYNSNLFPERLQ
jgi:hypothetical protein